MRRVSSLFHLLFALSYVQLLFKFHLQILLSFIIFHLEFARNSLENGACPFSPSWTSRKHKLVLFFSDDPQVTGRSASQWHYSVHISPRGTSRILSHLAPVSSSAVPAEVRSSEWPVPARLYGSLSSTSCSQVFYQPRPEDWLRRWAYRPHSRWGGLGCMWRCSWVWDQCTWSRTQPF